MADRRFVKVTIVQDESDPISKYVGYAWGLLDYNDNFRCIYTASERVKSVVTDNEPLLLYDQEAESAVEATEENTRNHIFAKLAVFALTEGDHDDNE